MKQKCSCIDKTCNSISDVSYLESTVFILFSLVCAVLTACCKAVNDFVVSCPITCNRQNKRKIRQTVFLVRSIFKCMLFIHHIQSQISCQISSLAVCEFCKSFVSPITTICYFPLSPVKCHHSKLSSSHYYCLPVMFVKCHHNKLSSSNYHCLPVMFIILLAA